MICTTFPITLQPLTELDQVSSGSQGVSLKAMRFGQSDRDDAVAPHMGQAVEISEHGVLVEEEPARGRLTVDYVERRVAVADCPVDLTEI